jgi:hypothetical protein
MENKTSAAAFVAAQKGFGAALKSATNPHFKSRYADLSACVEAVIDALHANGFALLQVTHPNDTGVAVETILLHESGERITGGILHVPATKQDAQGYGSALTYARRYSLMATCGIAPEDDDGNAASKKKSRSKADVEAIIRGATTMMELQAKWASLTADEKLLATDAKDAKKAGLSTEPQGDGLDEARKLIAEAKKNPPKMAETEEEIEQLWK